MKSLFKNLSLRARIALCTGMVALCNVSEAFAQNTGFGEDIGSSVLDDAADSMTGLVAGFVRVIQIALGLGALVTLIMVIFNMFKGEREAAQKIGWWVVGLALGFALVSVVARLTAGV